MFSECFFIELIDQSFWRGWLVIFPRGIVGMRNTPIDFHWQGPLKVVSKRVLIGLLNCSITKIAPP